MASRHTNRRPDQFPFYTPKGREITEWMARGAAKRAAKKIVNYTHPHYAQFESAAFQAIVEALMECKYEWSTISNKIAYRAAVDEGRLLLGRKNQNGAGPSTKYRFEVLDKPDSLDREISVSQKGGAETEVTVGSLIPSEHPTDDAFRVYCANNPEPMLDTIMLYGQVEEKYAEIFIRSVVNGETQAAIGESLGVTESRICQIINRIKASIRRNCVPGEFTWKEDLADAVA